MVVTNALSQATKIVSNLTTGRPVSVTDPLGRTTGFTYDLSNRLKRTTGCKFAVDDFRSVRTVGDLVQVIEQKLVPA